jgi:hypothetical protein
MRKGKKTQVAIFWVKLLSALVLIVPVHPYIRVKSLQPKKRSDEVVKSDQGYQSSLGSSVQRERERKQPKHNKWQPLMHRLHVKDTRVDSCPNIIQ